MLMLWLLVVLLVLLLLVLVLQLGRVILRLLLLLVLLLISRLSGPGETIPRPVVGCSGRRQWRIEGRGNRRREWGRGMLVRRVRRRRGGSRGRIGRHRRVR